MVGRLAIQYPSQWRRAPASPHPLVVAKLGGIRFVCEASDLPVDAFAGGWCHHHPTLVSIH